MADSVAQTRLDEIVLDNIQDDVIKWCIERLNRANLYTGDSVLRANMKAVTASVDKLCKIELANAISEVIEKIQKLDTREYQKELLLKPFFSFDSDTPKPNASDTVYIEDSEKHLKKLIKHAKTPLERKVYEKKLNALYKKRKQK